MTKGGDNLDTYQIREKMIRADLCEIAARHSYQHGSRIIDEIMESFHITRKTVKEK